MAVGSAEEKQREIDDTSAVCLAIIGFMRAAHPSAMLEDVRAVVVEARRGRKLGGIRTVLRDLHEWVSGMPASDIGQLNARLKEQFGCDLAELVGVEKILRAVVKAGKVRNDEEFRIVERHVDHLVGSGENASRVRQLNQLLAEYKQSPKT